VGRERRVNCIRLHQLHVERRAIAARVAADDDDSAELLLQLQLSRRAASVAHVLDGGATVFPDVRVRTVSHAVPS